MLGFCLLVCFNTSYKLDTFKFKSLSPCNRIRLHYCQLYVLYCIVLFYYYTVLYVLYCIVLYCYTVLYCIVLYCTITILYCTYCIVLYCIAILYCIVLYCIVLYCIVLYCIAILYCIYIQLTMILLHKERAKFNCTMVVAMLKIQKVGGDSVSIVSL